MKILTRNVPDKILIFIMLCLNVSIDAQKLSMGQGNVLYICEDSTISAIGFNQGYRFDNGIWIERYQLGDGTKINRSYPVKVKGIHSAISVNAIGSIALLSDGTVWKWTKDSVYNLHKINIDSVILITAGLYDGIEIDYYAIKKDGSLWHWGEKERNIDPYWHTAIPEKLIIPKVMKVEAGQYCIIALCEDSSVWTWGDILVDGNRNDRPDSFYIYKPSKINSISDVIDVCAGIQTVYALKKDGTVWEWGFNVSNVVGNNSYPVKLKISDVKSISVGIFDVLHAIKNDGTLWYWPDSVSGGSLFSSPYIYPKRIFTPTKIEKVFSSGTNTFVYDINEQIYRWGSNGYGQLGNFTTFPINSPEIMPKPCLAVDCDTITLNPDLLKLDTAVYPGVPVKLNTSHSDADLYWWYPGDHVISGKYNQEAYVKIFDDTEFSAVIMDSYGCMRKERFSLRKKCDPNINLVYDSITYPGAKINLEAGVGSSYSWSPSNELSCQYCRNTTATIDQSETYIVSFRDSFDCQAQQKFIFRIRDCDTIISNTDKLILDTLISPGNSINLMASDAIKYNWEPSIGLNCDSCQYPVARIFDNTEFIATLYDKYHCQWTERFKLTNNCDTSTLINPPLTLDTVTYPDSQIEFLLQLTKSYLWQPANGLSCDDCYNPVATVSEPEEYTVILIDSFNCISKEKFIVRIRNCDTIQLNEIVLRMDTILHYPMDLPLMVTESYNGYKWNQNSGLSCTDCPSPILSADATSDYIVEVSDQWRCTFKEEFKIKIDYIEVVIPNVFSPNSDGINEYFEIQGLIPGSDLKIFNSKGILVFSSDNYDGNWDGKRDNGAILDEGTYWYILNIPYLGGYKGWIFLKR